MPSLATFKNCVSRLVKVIVVPFILISVNEYALFIHFVDGHLGNVGLIICISNLFMTLNDVGHFGVESITLRLKEEKMGPGSVT